MMSTSTNMNMKQKTTPSTVRPSEEQLNQSQLAPELHRKWYLRKPKSTPTAERLEQLAMVKQATLEKKELEMDELMLVLRDYLQQDSDDAGYFASEIAAAQDPFDHDLKSGNEATESNSHSEERSARVRLLCQFVENLSSRDYARLARGFERYYEACKRTALVNLFEKQGTRVPTTFNLSIGLEDSVNKLKNIRPSEKVHHKVTFVRQITTFLERDIAESALPRFLSNIDSFTLADFYEAMEISEDMSSRDYVAAVIPDALLAKPGDKTIYDNIQYQDDGLTTLFSKSICRPDNLVVLQFTSFTLSVRDILRALSNYGVVLAIEIFRNASNAKDDAEKADTISAMSSPCFAHVYFREAEAVEKLTSLNMRCFGISVHKHIIYPVPSQSHRLLRLARIPPSSDGASLKELLMEFADDVVSLESIEYANIPYRVNLKTRVGFVRFKTHDEDAAAYRMIHTRVQYLKQALKKWIDEGNSRESFPHLRASQVKVTWAIPRNDNDPHSLVSSKLDHFLSFPRANIASHLKVDDVLADRNLDSTLLSMWAPLQLNSDLKKEEEEIDADLEELDELEELEELDGDIQEQEQEMETDFTMRFDDVEIEEATITDVEGYMVH